MAETLKRITRSILVKYILSYGIIMAILITGIGFYVNGTIRDATRQNIVDTNINRLGVLRVQNEEKLSTLIDICTQIGFSPDIAPFKLQDSPFNAFQLKQKLAAYASTKNISDQMYIIFETDEYLYSMATSVSISLFSEHMMLLDNVSPEQLREFIRNKRGMPALLPVQGTQSVLTTNADMVLMSIPLRLNGRTRIGSVVFLIQDTAYQRMFEDSIYEPRNMYVIYDDEILSSARRIQSISDSKVIDASKDAPSVSELHIDGENYLMFIQQGDLLDVRYVSLIPESAVHAQTSRSLLMFGIFLFIILLPCLMLAVSFSRRFVKPIDEIRFILFGSSEAEPKGRGNHFEEIRSGIEQLELQNTMLNRKLDDSLIARTADFTKNFIKNRYISREEMLLAASALGFNVDSAFYAILLVRSAGMDGSHTELVGHSDVRALCMEMVEQGQSLLLIFADSHTEMEEWIAEKRVALLANDADTMMALSDFHMEYSEAGSAYLEASAAYDNRFIVGADNILRFADVSMSAARPDEFTGNFMDSFHDALLSGDASAVHARINELISALNARRFSLFTFRMIYHDIISILLKRYLDGGDEKGRLRIYDVFHLSSCRKVSDLAAILHEMCEEIITRWESRSPEKASPESEPILRISAYLRDHFEDPSLSIGAVAEMFGIRAASLSQEYKKVTGMHPSDHLSLLRMEKARELLLETELTVREVAAAVGYYDVTSFIRRFKKEISLTPAQYRKTNTGVEVVD